MMEVDIVRCQERITVLLIIIRLLNRKGCSNRNTKPKSLHS